MYWISCYQFFEAGKVAELEKIYTYLKLQEIKISMKKQLLKIFKFFTKLYKYINLNDSFLTYS